MLEYAIYSVISPEGCASILWKSADRAREAADALGITSARLLQLGLVDQVIDEPLGGAHRDGVAMAATLKDNLIRQLDGLDRIEAGSLVEARYRRLRGYGSQRVE
jgi:acetyl-CoA carboxylase carboxyl transferase subunit alpha